jgi:hypothetical protein
MWIEANEDGITRNDFVDPDSFHTHEKALVWLAQKYYKLLLAIGAQLGHRKSYDPLTIEYDGDKKIAHSYVFDFEDGGRHHPFRDLEQLEEMLDVEIVRQIALWNANKLGEFNGNG